jgi:hypothetical protein
VVASSTCWISREGRPFVTGCVLAAAEEVCQRIPNWGQTYWHRNCKLLSAVSRCNRGGVSAYTELGTDLLAPKLQAAVSCQSLSLTHCTAPVYCQHSQSPSANHFYDDPTVHAARTALDRRALDCDTGMERAAKWLSSGRSRTTQMSPDNPVAFHCAVLQLVLFADERRHVHRRIYGHRRSDSAYWHRTAQATPSQLGPTGSASLAVTHFTENPLVMVTNAQTDINIHGISTYQQHRDNSPRMKMTYIIHQWFPEGTSWIPRDPRPVPRGSVDIFL